ncbi:PDC sensor domain-containing protein [Solemya pervernicosa gill symbiont]|uniref:PDC sensor domain-containing protein n=1 Tax=Solemya pervernicosa gill symbiont TaxID=642797 RepID=UPI0010845941|nr:PDC sensor domain-containing protein [Solemya pervernicosa gill symbiont]
MSSVIFLAAVSYYKWLDIKKETQIETTYLHKLLEQSSQDQFLQKAAMLRIFGDRLVDIGVFDNREKAQHLMDELLSENPVFVAYGLANPQGELILTSSNLSQKQLPNLLQFEKSAESFRAALNSRGVTLGRTYLFKPLNEWIIPLRYAVRDQAGEVVAVMTTGISLDGENNPWKIDGLPESVYINIIKDANAAGEYYPQFIHPLIMYGRDKEQTYDDPASQELVEHVVEHIEAAAGVDLDAFTQSGKAVYFNLKMPGVGQVYGTQGYNSDLKLFTAVRRSLLSMRDEFVAVFIWYFIVFTLFNVMLVVFRYINNLQREAKQQLEFQANHDQLTELPNRYYLKKKFPEWRKRWGNAYAR